MFSVMSWTGKLENDMKPSPIIVLFGFPYKAGMSDGTKIYSV